MAIEWDSNTARRTSGNDVSCWVCLETYPVGIVCTPDSIQRALGSFAISLVPLYSLSALSTFTSLDIVSGVLISGLGPTKEVVRVAERIETKLEILTDKHENTVEFSCFLTSDSIPESTQDVDFESTDWSAIGYHTDSNTDKEAVLFRIIPVLSPHGYEVLCSLLTSDDPVFVNTLANTTGVLVMSQTEALNYSGISETLHLVEDVLKQMGNKIPAEREL